MGSHEEREQTLNQLLAEMDGFDCAQGDHHHGRDQPPRSARPGAAAPGPLRPPGARRQAGRARAARRCCGSTASNVKLAPAVDLRKVAARTAGFAGADLANLVNEAALLAARQDKTAVEMRDFDEAIDRLIAGLEKKRVMSTQGARDRRVPRVGPRDRRQRAARTWTRSTRSRSSRAASARSATPCSCRSRIAT